MDVIKMDEFRTPLKVMHKLLIIGLRIGLFEDKGVLEQLLKLLVVDRSIVSYSA